MDQRWLVVMVKEPRPGQVKTRLARDIGPVAAAWWFRHQTARMIRHLHDRRWTLVLAVSPDREGLQSRVWPRPVPRIAQGRGDLGSRMARIFGAVPEGPVVIIGSDIPDITRARVWRAFRKLGSCEAVIGPAIDGGFWLIGLKYRRLARAGLFDGVRWSTAHARADTLERLAGLQVAEVDTLGDIDTAADLRSVP